MAPIPYDQRDGFIWMNGALVPWRDTKIHVLTHGSIMEAAFSRARASMSSEVFRPDESIPNVLHNSARHPRL